MSEVPYVRLQASCDQLIEAFGKLRDTIASTALVVAILFEHLTDEDDDE